MGPWECRGFFTEPKLKVSLFDVAIATILQQRVVQQRVGIWGVYSYKKIDELHMK